MSEATNSRIGSVLINQFVTPTFCLCFAFTGINFRGRLHHICDTAYDENMCGPTRTRKCRSTNDSNVIRNHNHVGRKRTLNHLAKWFLYELSDCGFESCCYHWNFRYGACFEQGVPWHSGKLKSVDWPWNPYVTW